MASAEKLVLRVDLRDYSRELKIILDNLKKMKMGDSLVIEKKVAGWSFRTEEGIDFSKLRKNR